MVQAPILCVVGSPVPPRIYQSSQRAPVLLVTPCLEFEVASWGVLLPEAVDFSLSCFEQSTSP